MASNVLQPLPPDFARTREGLHRLAEEVVKLAREHVTGEFSLIATSDGFGTPVFGPDDAQVRVEGGELLVAVGEEERREPISTLRAAAQLAAELLPEGLDLSDEPLGINSEASRLLGRWYGFGEQVLEALRGEAGPTDEPTKPTLWPEHFDLAIEMGPDVEGSRANYGLSPGDENHDDPYLYMGPWSAKPQGELWNAKGFSGAELAYAELAASDDPAAMALDFCRARKRALEEMEFEG
ncbi:MAG: hypothetical protein AABM29_06195 [Actinomycetota bacterium]